MYDLSAQAGSRTAGHTHSLHYTSLQHTQVQRLKSGISSLKQLYIKLSLNETQTFLEVKLSLNKAQFSLNEIQVKLSLNETQAHHTMYMGKVRNQLSLAVTLILGRMLHIVTVI